MLPVVLIGWSRISVTRTHGAVGIAAAVRAIVTAGIVLTSWTRGNRRGFLLRLGATGETYRQGEGQHQGQTKNRPISCVHDIILLLEWTYSFNPQPAMCLQGW